MKPRNRTLAQWSVLVAVVVFFAWLGSRGTDEERQNRRSKGESKWDHERRVAAHDHNKEVNKRKSDETARATARALATWLAPLTADRETPCPTQLGAIPVGSQPWLIWLAADRRGPRPAAPNSQSDGFDYATENHPVIGSMPGTRAAFVDRLLDAPHLAIAVPTKFEPALPAAEAPGFTGGTFEGFLVVVTTAERKVLCSAKLDVQIARFHTLPSEPPGPMRDVLESRHTWDDVFRERTTAALRRIAGPSASMAD